MKSPAASSKLMVVLAPRGSVSGNQGPLRRFTMMCRFSLGLGVVLALAARVPAGEVGMPAPAIEPTEWLNTTPTSTWAGLKGRLILIEKWATW